MGKDRILITMFPFAPLLEKLNDLPEEPGSDRFNSEIRCPVEFIEMAADRQVFPPWKACKVC